MKDKKHTEKPSVFKPPFRASSQDSRTPPSIPNATSQVRLFPALDPERQAAIEQRHKMIEESNARWREIRSSLMAVGGSAVAGMANGGYENDTSAASTFLKKDAKLVRSMGQGPHDRSLALFAARARFGCVLWTGYALHDDGIWRPWSWCVENGKVFETDQVQEAYWGWAVLLPRPR